MAIIGGAFLAYIRREYRRTVHETDAFISLGKRTAVIIKNQSAPRLVARDIGSVINLCGKIIGRSGCASRMRL